MVTSDPLRHPHHLPLDWVTGPGPSPHQITAKEAITVGITVRNLHRAGITPGGEGKTPKRKRTAQRRVQTCMLSMKNKITPPSWTYRATCSGKGSTKSGVTNTSTAMLATSTSCLLPTLIFLQLLLFSGGREKETKIIQMSTQTLSTNSRVDTLPLHLSLQVAAVPRHLSHRATVAPLLFIHQMTAVLLPLSRPVTVAPLHPRQGHVRSTTSCQSHLQRAVRMLNCREEEKTTP